MKRLHIFVIALALSGCGTVMQPADPAITARIVSACTMSGLFKMVEGVAVAAMPIAVLPVAVINAGVDIVCANPERFSADISTVEWVIRNLGGKP